MTRPFRRPKTRLTRVDGLKSNFRSSLVLNTHRPDYRQLLLSALDGLRTDAHKLVGLAVLWIACAYAAERIGASTHLHPVPGRSDNSSSPIYRAHWESVPIRFLAWCKLPPASSWALHCIQPIPTQLQARCAMYVCQTNDPHPFGDLLFQRARYGPFTSISERRRLSMQANVNILVSLLLSPTKAWPTFLPVSYVLACL